MVPNLIPISWTSPTAPGRFRPGNFLIPLTLATLLFPGLGEPSTKDQPIRGVTISTHTDGSDWGSPALLPTMKDIQSMGGNWVCIHPYGWLGKDGRIRFHDFDPRNPPAYLANPIRYAHELGLKILIKPHLGYWGSGFSWRGAIRFDTQNEWDQFFADYKKWIVLLAAGCRGADGFVVGTELDSTLAQQEKWREVIREVRTKTEVPLTYAANWTHFRDVGFWDALDVIGIQAYFPIATEKNPSPETLAAGWNKLMPGLGDFARRHNRKIVFTELGYTRSHSASIHPWNSHQDGMEAEENQARCLRAALLAVEQEPSIAGVFLWKWFLKPYSVGRNFQLATPRLMEVIGQTWRQDAPISLPLSGQ